MSHSIRVARVATITIVAVFLLNGLLPHPLDYAPEAEASLEISQAAARPSPAATTPRDHLGPMGTVPEGRPVPRAEASFRGAAPVLDVLMAQARIAPSPTAVPPTATPLAPTPTPTPSPRDLGVFKITGYSDSPYLNGTDGRGITRSGERTHWGVVAVDPMVIPLGTRLRIDGMGDTVFRALDTGGGIRGRWIDVWFHTDWDAIQHGVRHLNVHVLPDD